MPKRPRDFAAMVDELVIVLGRDAVAITRALIPRLYPETKKAADKEKCFAFFKSGVREAVKDVLDGLRKDVETVDFNLYVPGMMPFIQPLRRENYWVPSLAKFVTIDDLVRNLGWLDEARDFMRNKAKETSKVADMLDLLYAKATAMRDAGEPIFVDKDAREGPEDRPTA